MRMKLFTGFCTAVVGLTTASAGPPAIEVIFTEVPTEASSLVPGARDLAGQPMMTRFKALEDLNLSPNGQDWILRARSEAGSDLETMLILGNGLVGEMLAQEGQPLDGGVPGELYDFFDGIAGFNDQGHFAFGARARGGLTATAEKIIRFDGEFSIPIQQGDPALGLVDLPPNPTGDETFGNSLNSIHLLNDGRVGFVAVTINQIHSSRRPAIFYGNTAFAQAGVTPIGVSTWQSFPSDSFYSTPDGTTWLVRGDTLEPTTQDDIVVVNGNVVLREGQPVGDAGRTLRAIFHARLAFNGDWYARGDDLSNDDWVYRNGELIAATGQPLFPGSEENWGPVILAVDGNASGSHIVAGNTTAPFTDRDEVIVFNGTRVVVREGDQLDLDGDGVLDDAYIGRGNSTLSAFNPDDMFLTDAHVLYFIASLRNAAMQDLGSIPAFGNGGNALLRLRLNPLGDMNCDGLLDFDDIDGFVLAQVSASEYRDAFPGCGYRIADMNEDGHVDFDDIEVFVSCLITGGC